MMVGDPAGASTITGAPASIRTYTVVMPVYVDGTAGTVSGSDPAMEITARLSAPGGCSRRATTSVEGSDPGRGSPPSGQHSRGRPVVTDPGERS